MDNTSKEESTNKVQTGIDSYILVKRKSSPLRGNSRKVSRAENVSEQPDPLSKNRFAPLSAEDQPIGSNLDPSTMPLPIFLQERSFSELVKNIVKTIGTNAFLSFLS